MDGAFVQGNTARLPLRRDVPNNRSSSIDLLFRLAIALGGDADTLAAIAGPIAYAHYKYMPEELVKDAKNKLPKWMLDVSKAFDKYVEKALENCNRTTE